MMELAERKVCPDAIPFLDAFERFEKQREEPRWLVQLRRGAFDYFAKNGFPTLRQENWRFTNIAPVKELCFEPAEKVPDLTLDDVRRFAIPELDCFRLVFVDGRFAKALSNLPPENSGVVAGSLGEQLGKRRREIEQHLGQHICDTSNAFTLLNTTFFKDGAFVFVPDGKQSSKPIHLLFIKTGRPEVAVYERNLIYASRGSRLQILETHVSLKNEPILSNTVTELVLRDGASVEHCKIQMQGEKTFHFSTIDAEQEADSHFNSHSIAAGACLARNGIGTSLMSPGAQCLFNGLFLGHENQLVDHHTIVDHVAPNCESHEYYNGILSGKSHGVFNGRIFVRRDAQKTNARQTNRNLLLSDEAVINTKPQLEIFADDVKCTHGATVGRLNEEQLFYLQSRGIGEETARRMLIQAFASEVVARIELPAVRDYLNELLMLRFA
mgnify:CR=1 FL=1